MNNKDDKELLDILSEAKSALNDFCYKMDGCPTCPYGDSRSEDECDNDRLIADIYRMINNLTNANNA